MMYPRQLLSLGLGLYVALLPWQTRFVLFQPHLGVERTEYGSLSVYATDLLLIVIILGAVLATRVQRPRSTVGYGWLALVMVCLGSALFANRVDVALWSLRTVLVAGAVWWLLQQQWAKRSFILACFVGGAVLQALFGIGQFLAQFSPAASWLGLAAHDPATVGTSVVEVAGARWLRAYGSLPHPNILGGYLAVALLVAFGFYLRVYDDVRQGFATWTREHVRRDVLGRRWYWQQAWRITGLIVVLAILTTALLLTFSRSAWIGFVAGWVAFLPILIVQAWPWGWQLWVKWTLGIAAIGACVILAVPQPFTARTTADGRLEQQSLSTRQQQFEDAYALLKREPLRGVGYGNMVVAIRDQLGVYRASVHDYQPVHNIYLLSAVELGVIGALVFLAVCVLALRTALIQAFTKGRWYHLTAVASIACLLVIGLFDHYLWSLGIGAVLLWFSFSEDTSSV